MFSVNKMSFTRTLTALGVGSILLFIPLLGDLHFESAVFFSVIGAFWGGVRGSEPSRSTNECYQALGIAYHLYLIALPLLIYALAVGCFSVHGLAFWLLFPLPSIFLGYATGRLVRKLKLPNRKSLTISVLVLVAVGIFVYEFFTYPQVYFFNHVWGGWPGPIYDETVKVTGATVFFRFLTVLWTLLLWYIPGIGRNKYAVWIVALAAILLGIGYTQLSDVGIASPRPHIQKELGGYKATQHFDLYYDEDLYATAEIDRLAKEHEFYFQQIAKQLKLANRHDLKIESYLYGHPWQKKKLVGAKFTSYVPIWLQQDQLHIAKQQIQSSLRHELVHVLAKQFGNTFFNGSWSIGLIEGVAVAIDGGNSETSTIDQIVVSEKPYPTTQQLQKLFSITGFYGGRSGVNYTTSGSFVRFLLQNYPVESLKKAYQLGSISQAYQEDWGTLVNKWHQHLESVKVDSIDEETARRIFGYPSLFERKCPHVVSDFQSYWDNYHFHLANHDTAKSLEALDRAVAAADSSDPIKAEWSYRHLKRRDAKLVQQAANLQDTTVDLQLLYADAFVTEGLVKKADKHMSRAQVLFAEKPDSSIAPAVETRSDSLQWAIYRRMTYQDILPDSSTYRKANYRTKIRSLRKAVDREQWPVIVEYAKNLQSIPYQDRYFTDFKNLIHRLGWLGEVEEARTWIKKLSAESLRKRHQELLEDEKEWIMFLVEN